MLQFLLTDLMRSVHIVAGAVWVGGSVVYLLVIVPALRLGEAAPRTAALMGDLFRRLVNVCIAALLVSGVYLIVDWLNSTSIGAAYVIVLVVKIAAALAMIALALLQAQEARRLAKRRGKLWRLAPRWILGLGIVTFILGATLTGLFEANILR